LTDVYAAFISVGSGFGLCAWSAIVRSGALSRQHTERNMKSPEWV
jgi:hypothetical protein